MKKNVIMELHNRYEEDSPNHKLKKCLENKDETKMTDIHTERQQ